MLEAVCPLAFQLPWVELQLDHCCRLAGELCAFVDCASFIITYMCTLWGKGLQEVGGSRLSACCAAVHHACMLTDLCRSVLVQRYVCSLC
jgi:hypothetical protein